MAVKKELTKPIGEKDSRLGGKPRSNNGELPVMEYYWDIMPLTCENIWHAQMAGWPRILTYDYVADTSMKKRLMSYKRYHNLSGSGVVSIRGSWRDEYPFASTVENGGSTFVGHAPIAEQIAQGVLIGKFYSDWKAARHSAEQRKPFYFEVKVLNIPAEKKAVVRHWKQQALK